MSLISIYNSAQQADALAQASLKSRLEAVRTQLRFISRDIQATEGRFLDFNIAETLQRSLHHSIKLLEAISITVAVLERKGVHTMAKTQARKRLTPRDVADLTEEIVVATGFDDFVLAALVCIADEFTAAVFDSTRVENLATAIRDRAYILTPHSGAACGEYATETRAVVEAALTNIKARK